MYFRCKMEGGPDTYRMKYENHHIIFETERLVVRRYTTGDGDNFFLMNGDEEIMRYIRPPKTREEADAFLLEIIKYAEENPLYGRWAVDDKQAGEFVGSFAVIPVEKTDAMQLGYSLLKTNWGKGYATELTMGGLRYVFTKTNLDEIWGVTETGNTASQKVLVKAGLFIKRPSQKATRNYFNIIFSGRTMHCEKK